MSNFLHRIMYKLGYTHRFGTFRKIFVPVEKNTYAGKELIKGEEGNNLIAQKIQEGKPLLVGRLGSVELSALYNAYIYGNKNVKWDEEVTRNMNNNAGFFSISPENLERYCREMHEHLNQVDILGVWHNEGEEDICKTYCAATTEYVTLPSLEPYYFPDNPWSQYLAGKKVLAVHPFEDSIKYQYATNRAKLFPGKNILPEFELKTIKAVQSIAGSNPGYKTWFDAYQHMCDQIQKIDFDIAIIGAGAYGLPLAGFAKKIGKQAIHMGGASQLLFGVTGNRWLHMPKITQLVNDNWKRPYPHETPTKADNVENACYW